MAAESNFQDALELMGGDTLQFNGERFVLGSGSDGKSFVFSNSTAAQFLVANPTANRTISFPDADGTVAMLSNIGLTAISAGTTRATSGEVVFSNANSVSFGVNGQTVTASISTLPETPFGISAGTQSVSTGTLVFSNSNGVSFGINGNTITATVVAGAAAGIAAISAGTQQATSGSIVFSNSNGISFGMSGSTRITASVDGATAISAGTTRATSGEVVFSNSNGVTFGVNGNTVTASVDAAGGGLTLSYFNPQDAYVQVAGDQGNATLHIQPMQAPNVTFDRVAIPLFFSGNATVNATLSYTYLWGVYTRNVSTLSSYMTTSISSTAFHNSNNNSSIFNGIKLLTIPFSSSLSEGQYWVGIMRRSSTAGTSLTFSQILASQQNSNFSGVFGVASNATIQYTRGLGVYTASTTALPASIGFSQINGSASLALRQPMFYVVSGTV